MMTEILRNIDDMILETRDKKAFRFKVFKLTCIKTIMGPVEIDRRVYKHVDEDGKKSYRYLLDEYLNMETIGHMSANLVEKMIENVTNVSLRKTSHNVKEMTVKQSNDKKYVVIYIRYYYARTIQFLTLLMFHHEICIRKLQHHKFS
jgi:hypothetical protein